MGSFLGELSDFLQDSELAGAGADGKQVAERFRSFAHVAQERRRVVDRRVKHAVALRPLPVLAGNAEVRGDQPFRGNSAEADDDLRPQEGKLRRQIADTGILLVVHRVAVLRWAALDDVGNVRIIAAEVDDREHVVKQVSRGADERLALQILLLPRSFADEDDGRRNRADAEDGVRPRCAEATLLTRKALRADRFHVSHCAASLPLCADAARRVFSPFCG